jgi:hypothetical protein
LRIFNEKEYAENIIQNGFNKNKFSTDLKILAKYYRSQGLSSSEIKQAIVGCCGKHDDTFNMVLSYSSINKAIKHSETNSLFIVEPVIITRKELETISSIGEIKLGKIAFVMLVLSKINYQYFKLREKDSLEYNPKKPFEVSSDHYCTEKVAQIFKLAKIYTNTNAKYEATHILTKLGLIQITGKNNYRIKFAEIDGDPAMIIANFKDFVLEYEKYLGEKNIGYCEECRCNIRITSNRSQYCKECFKNNRKKYKADKEKEYRRNRGQLESTF